MVVEFSKEATEGNKLCMEGIDQKGTILGKGLANIRYKLPIQSKLLQLGGIISRKRFEI